MTDPHSHLQPPRLAEALLRVFAPRGEFGQSVLGDLQTLMGLFAVVALTLGAVGLYGVMSYGVAQRTNEIGVRIALGADTRDVTAMVVGQGMKLALIEVGVGLVGSFAITRVMNSLLFNVSATDLVTFATVSALLVLTALLASYLPARRATKIDPMTAMRSE